MKVFLPERAINSFYRIPSLIRLKNGDLLAFADCRRFSCQDSPNRIDQCYKRSKNNGESWSETVVFLSEQGDSPETGSAAIDGTALYDEENNIIYYLYNMTPAGIGAMLSQKGNGMKHGGFSVFNAEKQYLWKEGKLFTEDEKETQYSVDDNANIYFHGKSYGNLKSNLDGFRLAQTSFLMLTKSYDNGYTWERPICLNELVKTENMGFLGPGPGIGIKLKRGAHKNRLLFPVYYSAGKQPSFMGAVIYSDDGKLWKMSKPLIDYKKDIDENGVYKTDTMCITEGQVFERQNGEVVLYARNHDMTMRMFEFVSQDGGESFGNKTVREDLPQCICQASVIQFETEDKAVYNAFCNPASTTIRNNGMLRLSLDEGRSYPFSYRFEDKEFIYSSMTYLGNGEIGVLYEKTYDTIAFEKIKIKEIIKNL